MDKSWMTIRKPVLTYINNHDCRLPNMDKSWMTIKDRMSREYRDGVKSFVDFAIANTDLDDEIRCPCMKCMNAEHHNTIVVAFHLVQNGIATSYKTWVHHGEPIPMHQVHASNENCRDNRTSVENRMENDELEDQDDLPNLVNDYYKATIMHDDNNQDELPNNVDREAVRKFEKLLEDAHRELYPGCKFTLLSFVVKLLHVKVLNRWSNKSFDALLGLLKEVLPINDEQIPSSIYEAKKFLRDLGLGYVSIHACKYDCALFWKENENLENCPVCQEPRYKLKDGKGKKIPHKILRYFPLTPRLQRLYMSTKTCSDMRWHKEKRTDDEVLRHPADGEAWKDFDRQYPEFAQEARNVRLGLATDGFNPFGNMSTSYSMWPVIVVPYNLPPWKCMKQPFSMLSLLIPGPQAPGRDIDVYLRPLIDELKELWKDGVLTYDASTEQTFQMHAAVMWTINDFPAYGNLSGWTTKGYLACPCCNEYASSQKLRSKIGYTGARRWLPKDHPWRRSRQFDGKSDNRTSPLELTGEQIFQQVTKGTYKPFGKHPSNKRKREDPVLNWSKISIFFELPYWEKLKLRHNLDVMHIEKNICDSLLGMLLSIDGKNKDTEKARFDLEDMKIRKELHLLRRADGSFEKPPALYTLSPEERHGFYEFLKSIRYPDGYAANISRCVSTKGDKLSGLKSHDCHVLLQRILPIGMRGYLGKDICTTLFELGNFFQQLCSKTLRLKDLEKLQERIVFILCKMEKIFPPAFFDVMVHLAIHLPREAMLGGPVQYRWMYPIERLLGTLKGYVTNRAYPEGSISEAYIVKECLTFCSMYLGEMETVFNQAERNIDGGIRGEGLTVFTQNVRPFGLMTRASNVTQEETNMAHWFVLNNSSELQQYLEEHKRKLEDESGFDIPKRQQENFPRWFKEQMNQLRAEGSLEATDELWSLANGPGVNVNIYSGCICNGVRFHTKDRDSRRKSQNSGVVVEGDQGEKTIDFYGYLCQVWELNYMLGRQVVLFQCVWFNTGSSRTFCSDLHSTSIDVRSRWYKNDPFVLPSQVKQVFYVNDTKFGENWKVVERLQHRGIWDVPEKDALQPADMPNDVFQQDETSDDVPIVLEDPVVQFNRTDIDPEIIPNSVVLQSHNRQHNNSVDDEEDESVRELSEDEENELPSESDTDIDPDIEP